MRDADSSELVAGLGNDLAPMGKHERGLTLGRARLDDNGSEHSLSGTGRRDQQNTLVTRGDGALESINHGALSLRNILIDHNNRMLTKNRRLGYYDFDWSFLGLFHEQSVQLISYQCVTKSGFKLRAGLAS